MNELKWNEYEIVECLGVLPDFDSFFTSYSYSLEKDGLVLEMTIWRHENLIAISLAQITNKSPFITIYFLSDEIAFENEKEFSALRFSNCLIVPNRFYYINNDLNYKENNFTNKIEIEFRVYPALQINFY